MKNVRHVNIVWERAMQGAVPRLQIPVLSQTLMFLNVYSETQRALRISFEVKLTGEITCRRGKISAVTLRHLSRRKCRRVWGCVCV